MIQEIEAAALLLRQAILRHGQPTERGERYNQLVAALVADIATMAGSTSALEDRIEDTLSYHRGIRIQARKEE